MQGFVDTVFGHGKDLNALQMSARALVIFFVSLVLVRLAGMRAFGRKSSFDTVILVGFGSVITRAIHGASPAIPIICACTTLVLVHRFVGMLTARVPLVERLVKGETQVLYHEGQLDQRKMRRAGISPTDLDEAARGKAQTPSHHDVREVRLETSGELTVID
jgi:uncharacterized membrane protein YcaP (DUF421 family)